MTVHLYASTMPLHVSKLLAHAPIAPDNGRMLPLRACPSVSLGALGALIYLIVWGETETGTTLSTIIITIIIIISANSHSFN